MSSNSKVNNVSYTGCTKKCSNVWLSTEQRVFVWFSISFFIFNRKHFGLNFWTKFVWICQISSEIHYNPANSNPLGEYELGSSHRVFRLSGSICMQISTKRNANLVPASGASNYSGFELTVNTAHLYKIDIEITNFDLTNFGHFLGSQFWHGFSLQWTFFKHKMLLY